MFSSINSTDINFPENEFEIAFSYANMTKCHDLNVQAHCLEYYSYYEPSVSKDFVVLEKKSAKFSELGKKEKGLKFHISLANINNNIENAWNIFIKYIVKYKLYSTKVICDHLRESIMINVNHAQAGKEITLYAYQDNRDISEWKMFIEEITKEFIANKIYPARFPKDDYRIKGSKYFSYRNDSLLVSYKDISEESIEIQRDDEISVSEIEIQIDSDRKSNSESSSESERNSPSTNSDDISQLRFLEIDVPNQPDRILDYSNILSSSKNVESVTTSSGSTNAEQTPKGLRMFLSGGRETKPSSNDDTLLNSANPSSLGI